MEDLSQVKEYIKNLADAFPNIREVWLFGSRADSSYNPGSDWDLFVFADSSTFKQISEQPNFRHSKIDLLVVIDDDHFCEPWSTNPNPKKGSFSDWEWRLETPTEAVYRQTKKPEDGSGWYRSEVSYKKAKKLWPQEAN